MLTRKRQLAAKIESIEGTAETLAAADAKILAYESEIVLGSPEMFKRSPALSSLGKKGSVSGKRPGTCSAKFELRGSGTATLETEWSKIIRACGLKISTLSSITIGAVSGGPFQHGETITGTLSGATGRVIINTATGITTLYFVAVGSAVFQNAETITGGTSGATATTGSTASAAGKVWEPTSTESLVPSLTLGGYMDGIRNLLAGCRGNMKLDLSTVGESGMIECAMSGVYAGIADTDFFTGITYPTTKPPAWLSSGFTINSYAARINQFGLDLGNTVSPHDDANNAYGLVSYVVTDREPTVTLTIEDVLLATKDFWSLIYAGTEIPIDITVGSVTGSKFRFFAPKAQITNISRTDRAGIQNLNLSMSLNEPDNLPDTELALLAL